MRVALVCLLLAAAALASPVTDLEQELKNEGDDIEEVHEVIEEMNERLHDELAPKDDEDRAEMEELEKEEDKENCNRPAPMKEDIADSGAPDINELNKKAGLEKDLFEGDLMLNPRQMLVIAEADMAGNRSRRQAMMNAGYSWGAGNGQIPFKYSNGYPSDRYTPIETAMKFWTDNTCVTFRKATTADKNVVEVRESGGCSSNVGKIGGTQALNLGKGCMNIGTIAHELSHTLGMFHVQSRYDRDQYVYVDTTNIQSGMEHNFNIEGKDTTTLYSLPYEFGSNMHYGAGDFGINTNKPVLVAKTANKAYQNGMMGRMPTFYDVMLVNTHYNCYANCKTKPTCANGGVVDVRNCAKCKCPFGWAGNTCSERPAGTKTLTATASPQTFSVNMGTWGAKEALTYTTQTYVITAPAGKKVSITPTYQGTQWSNSCAGMGVEIQFKADKKAAGTQICDWRIVFDPIVSEDNTVVVQVYTLGGQVAVDFSYKTA